MARIIWNAAGSRFYEAGVDRGVLYVDGMNGVPWTGLVSVDEDSSGGDAKPYYIDGEKYSNRAGREEFTATIKAYTYPDQFAQCDGSFKARNGLYFTQQRRKQFSLSYRTMVGNDSLGTGFGYKLHLVYNALAAPSQRSYSSFSSSAEPSDFSWSLTTKPPITSGYLRTAHVIVDSRDTHPITLAAIEDILYGTDSNVARMPSASELITIFDTLVDLVVVDNGDQSFRITGPANAVQDIGLGNYTISWPSVELDADGATISY